MDTKFSVALHILAFISETDEEANSTTLANSVNTNSSHIRKITALLKKAGLLISQQGKSGFQLVRNKDSILLSDVYKAVYPKKSVLHVHEDANTECPIGSHIGEILTPTFAHAEEALLRELQKESLADLINKLYAANQNK
ncbi:MAG: Rrf2 family transcriptional regulator [Methanobrevibacter sp.]|nr:Rrf2 family transcriptional regulator [Methanobrevibacter sp.]